MQSRSGSLCVLSVVLINKLILVAHRFVSGFLDLPWQIQVHIGELVEHKRIVIRMASIPAEHRMLMECWLVLDLDGEFDECLDCGDHWVGGLGECGV